MYSSERFRVGAYVRVTGLDEVRDTNYGFPEQNTNEQMHSVVEHGDKLWVREALPESSSIRLSDGYAYPAHRVERQHLSGSQASTRERLREIVDSMRAEFDRVPTPFTWVRPIDDSVVHFTVPEPEFESDTQFPTFPPSQITDRHEFDTDTEVQSENEW